MASKPGMMVDLCIAYNNNIDVLMIVLMTTLIQCHSGLAKAKIQCWIILTTKWATSIKLATNVGHFLHDLNFKNVYGLTVLFLLLFILVCIPYCPHCIVNVPMRKLGRFSREKQAATKSRYLTWINCLSKSYTYNI